MLYALAIFCTGGLGSVLRYLSDSSLRARFESHPLGLWITPTVIINIVGSLLYGVLAACAYNPRLESATAQTLSVLMLGFLGGFTTFSTAMVEAVQALAQRAYYRFFILWAGQLMLAVVFVSLSYILTMQILSSLR